MPENISTSRRGSISMLARGQSEAIDIDFEALKLDDVGNIPIAPSSPLREARVNQPPLRERFGAGMTIVAATSPEIKALNLPSTPAFPPTRLDFSRSSSFSFSPNEVSLVTPQPTLTRAQSMRERVSFCLDTMDDVEDVPSFPSLPSIDDQSAPSSFYHDDDEADDLLRFLNPNKLSYHPDENKENVHPNLIQEQSEKAILTLNVHDDDPSKVKKKSRHGRRKSTHRRISCESLPSPAEIGPSPLSLGSQTPRRRTVQMSCNALNFSLPSLDEPSVPHFRPNSQPSMSMPAKSLQLSTGFR